MQKTLRDHGRRLVKVENDINVLKTTMGRFAGTAGKGWEKAILGIYKKALELHGVEVKKIQHGEIEDTVGVISKGRKYEVDFYETNDYVYVFEVKAFADEGVIEQIENRIKLFSALYKKPVKAFVVCNYIYKSVKEALEKEGVIVIYSNVVKD